MKRALALCLLLALLIPTLFSCGKKSFPPEPSGTVSATTANGSGSRTDGGKETTATDGRNGTPSGDGSTQTATTTTDPWEPVASALSGLDETYRTILIELDASETAETGARNARLFAGPDAITGATPAAERAIFERNRDARERLGVSALYTYWDDACGDQSGKIVTAAKGANAPDLFVNTLRDLTRAALQGCFRDVYAAAGSYLDLAGDGWLTEFVASASLTHDRAYILAGDAFPDLFRGATVLPFNRSMIDDKTERARLSPCILPNGETLGAGEKLSDRFFDLIAAGKWTFDVLRALSEAVFSDNGDRADTDDFSDLLGFVCDTAADTAAGAFFAARGTDYLSESTDGETGCVTLTYRNDGGTLGALFDAISRLIGGNGTLVTTGGFSDLPDQPGLAAHRRKFAAGSLLFLGAVPLGALGYDETRAMTDEFAIAPMPKLLEADRYVTPLSPDADAGAVNRSSAAYPAVSAYLQFLSENSGAAVDAYLVSLTGK
ncbi:MAG: hypothetical protein IKX66_03870, partial [Clostridia bacterium]|nr:hypothetical protein [Clostridia bacterium]